jgi:hypothetical protein
MQTVSAMPTGLFLIVATVASNTWPRSRRQPAAVAVINGAANPYMRRRPERERKDPSGCDYYSA